jgi:hypothetical protein
MKIDPLPQCQLGMHAGLALSRKADRTGPFLAEIKIRHAQAFQKVAKKHCAAYLVST